MSWDFLITSLILLKQLYMSILIYYCSLKYIYFPCKTITVKFLKFTRFVISSIFIFVHCSPNCWNLLNHIHKHHCPSVVFSCPQVPVPLQQIGVKHTYHHPDQPQRCWTWFPRHNLNGWNSVPLILLSLGYYILDFAKRFRLQNLHQASEMEKTFFTYVKTWIQAHFKITPIHLWLHFFLLITTQ